MNASVQRARRWWIGIVACGLAAALGMSPWVLSGAAEPPARATGDARVRALQQERIAALRAVKAMVENENKSGNVAMDDVIRAEIDVRRAEFDASDNDVERQKLLEQSVEYFRELEKYAKARAAVGGIVRPVDPLRVKAERLEAEIALERFRSGRLARAKL